MSRSTTSGDGPASDGSASGPEPGAGPAPGASLQSVGRALRVLRLLGEHDHLGSRAVAARLDVNPAVAHRLLTTLTAGGFVEQNSTSREYHLGPVVGELGEAYQRANPFLLAARVTLEQLGRVTGETVALQVLRDGSRRCVMQLESPQRLRYSMTLNTPMPVTNGATDQVFRAYADAKELEAVVAVIEATASGGSGAALMGLDDRDLLARDYGSISDRKLTAVRRRGWAKGLGLREAGVGSVAAPVRRGPLYALTVFGPESRIQAAGIDALGELVREAAVDLEGD